LVKNIFRAERFVPFTAGRARIGWLRPELAARLSSWPKVFATGPDKVVLLNPADLSPVIEQLAQEGFIPGWRNERYAVEGGFEIERAAARPFGLTTRAVHVNGISFDGRRMWLARRASTKAIDPGMLDNLVGGGITAGLSVEEVLVKEAWEEAGVPAELARKAAPGDTLRILREVPEGVQSEVVHAYNLVLPDAFEPRNQDGEVSEFLLLPFAEIESQDLTFEARLVALDYLRSSAR
jgi:8-oxo-dGTP pyrophosphatase MutT (NUDIX family)